MRILISADMEGATGVTWPGDVDPGTPGWQRLRSPFTSDVNAAIAGFCSAGADGVLVNEAHATQRNLLLEMLDDRAELLTGYHKRLSMVEGVATDVDGVAFLGYHTGAGVQGVLSHTFLPNSITGVFLDGTRASEGRLAAAVVAEFGVPVLLVTGDDLTCADAADYAPEAVGVAVKRCVSRYAAICRTPALTATDIRAGAAASMERAGRRTPAEPTPHRIEVEYDAAQLAAAVACIPSVDQIADRRVGFTSASMVDAWLCFKVTCTVASSATEEHYG